jgi:hypothetical protein
VLLGRAVREQKLLAEVVDEIHGRKGGKRPSTIVAEQVAGVQA